MEDRGFHSDNNRERAPSRISLINGLTPRPLSRLSILNAEAPPTKRPNCPMISLLSGALNDSQGPNIYRADLENKWKLEEENEEVRKQTIDYSSKFREILEGISKDFSEKSEKGLATLKFLINDTSEIKTHIQKYEITINTFKPKLEEELAKIKLREDEIELQKKELFRLKEKHKKLLLKEESLREEIGRKNENKASVLEKMEEQSRQSQAEYIAIERALCFTIKKPGQDLLSFKFTSVSEKNPKEVCKITLNISSSEYSFAECRPAINNADEYLAQLNESRNILEFLVSMRQGFQDFYRSSC